MNKSFINVNVPNEIKDKQPVGMLSKDELVDVFGSELKRQHIDTIDDLLNWLKFELPLTDDYSTQAYIALLKKELAFRAENLPKLCDSYAVGRYLASKYSDLDVEELHIIAIDNGSRLISDECLSRGTKTKSLVDTAEVVKKLVLSNATGFFISHNHPSGKLVPSKNDLDLTVKLKQVASLLKIDLLDHFIVGNGQYYSMREHDLI